MNDQEAPTGEPAFEDLPVNALKRTLCFLGNVADILACELTFTGFRQVVSTHDLDVWGLGIPDNCVVDANETDPTKKYKKEDPRFGSFREQACVKRNIGFIRRQQSMTSNILLDVFEGEEVAAVGWWKEVVTRILHLQGLQDGSEYGKIVFRHALRGDTMGTLLEILQFALIKAFEQALNICITTTPDDTYPELKASHLTLQDQIKQDAKHGCTHYILDRCTCLFVCGEVSALGDLTETGHKIIRPVAFRAGVTKMENAAIQNAWNGVMNLIFHIFEHALPALVAKVPVARSSVKQKMVATVDTIRDIPPLPRLDLSVDSNDEDTKCYLLTPVPRMIEKAYSEIFPSLKFKRVYNEPWLTDDDNVEDEIASAEAEYEWVAFDHEQDDPDPYETEVVLLGNVIQRAVAADDYTYDDSSYWSADEDSQPDVGSIFLKGTREMLLEEFPDWKAKSGSSDDASTAD